MAKSLYLMREVYSEELWNEWLKQENENYQLVTINGKNKKKYLKNGYIHFDHKIWLPDNHTHLQAIVSDPQKVTKHVFHPFIKVLTKSPRLKYDQEEDEHGEYELTLTTKIRPICLASHIDSLILGFYGLP